MLMLKFGFFILFLFRLTAEWRWIIFIVILTLFLWLNSIRSYNLGIVDLFQMDNLSFLLNSLTFWIISLILIIRFYVKSSKNFPQPFSVLRFLILIFLIFSFSTSNVLVFYVMFEATLIPIFLLVIGWGYQPERITASYFLLFYTLTASLPLLLRILFIDNSLISLDFIILSFFRIRGTIVFWGLILAFLVKLPIYLGHLWLPKAHVEAPVAGSIILAGVLLKLGGYGLIRVTPLIQESIKIASNQLVPLGLVGGIFASLICLRQVDCKSLVAYSSVAHIALVIVGLTINTFYGMAGGVVIIIAHGICSSGLFALVGIVYERTSTRNLIILRGIITCAPLLSLWWFLFRIRNMAAPPTPRLAGEIYIFIRRLSWFGTRALFVGLLSFLAGAYNLYLFVGTQHGNKIDSMRIFLDASLREHLILTLHFIPFIFSIPLLINFYSYCYSLK